MKGKDRVELGVREGRMDYGKIIASRGMPKYLVLLAPTYKGRPVYASRRSYERAKGLVAYYIDKNFRLKRVPQKYQQLVNEDCWTSYEITSQSNPNIEGR